MAELKIKRMSDIQAEPVSWLWEPYIPRGKITIVQGDPGDGKTTMMLPPLSFFNGTEVI